MLTKAQRVWVALLLLFVTAAWVFWAIFGIRFIGWLTSTDTVDKAGQWGDTFGGLNAAFGAIGACVVLATLLVQRNAIEQQRSSLTEQRKLIDQQRSEQHRDRFETTFFKLLDLLRELKQAEVGQPGKSVINIAAGRMLMGAGLNLAQNEHRDFLVKTYDEQVHKPFERHLSPYFRVVYTMLKRIEEETNLSEQEKIGYGNLLRSQLTSDEVTIAGYNGLSSVSKDFGKLLERFRILKYLPSGPHRDALKRFYAATAFEARDD